MTCISPDLLPKLRKLLEQKGFYSPGALQLYKRGQVFGLVRRLDKVLEMHVRGFKDGRVESEIEISRDFLEHLGSNACRPAQAELEKLLNEARIPFVASPPNTSSKYIVLPNKLTDWRRLVALTFLAGLVTPILAVAMNHPFIRKDSR